jgi:hypothetical protein
MNLLLLLVCGWCYPLLIIAKGGSFFILSMLRLYSSTSIACGFPYEKDRELDGASPLDKEKHKALYYNKAIRT